jgi:hypothetical protein
MIKICLLYASSPYGHIALARQPQFGRMARQLCPTRANRQAVKADLDVQGRQGAFMKNNPTKVILFAWFGARKKDIDKCAYTWVLLVQYQQCISMDEQEQHASAARKTTTPNLLSERLQERVHFNTRKLHCMLHLTTDYVRLV